MFYYFKKLVPQSVKNFYHWFQAITANLFFGFPSRNLTVIGVTGTNGKTTTCQMIVRILETAGKKVALASTINFKIGDKEWVNKTKFTTVSAWQIQKFIFQAAKAGCDYAVLETSSHALDQKRVWGINYQVAVITNLTREHLDYHQTMEKYFQAKLKLFRSAPVVVVNLTLDKAEEFFKFSREKWGYYLEDELFAKQKIARKQSEKIEFLEAEKIKLKKTGVEFVVRGEKMELNLLGRFNIENALAAIAVGLSEGINLPIIKQALKTIKKVSGRLDEVTNDQGIKIFIDYAVTPDSMKKIGELLKSIQPVGSRLIWIFGACGERDQGKRPIMGEIVAKFADLAIVTNEDPYGEDPQAIIEQVFQGLIKKTEKMQEGKNCWKILDRRLAIRKALELAQKGDWVLVTGKGAEETMAISATERIVWNDRQVIEEELARRKKSDNDSVF